MLKALSKWFGESQMAIPEDNILQCNHESHMHSCDLIEELKVKQEERKRLYLEVKEKQNLSALNLSGIRKIIKVYSDEFRHMPRHYFDPRYIEEFEAHFLEIVINKIIGGITNRDIEMLCTDLLSLKNKEEYIASRNGRIKQLDIEIAEIKSMLGIE